MSDLGDLLRRARAHKGVTLRDAEKRTRISRTYLAALEAHDFDQLPPQTYARGIVRNYAQYLGLDPAAILSMYDAAVRDGTQQDQEVQVAPAVQPIEIHGHWAPNFAIIIFMLVISAVLFTWIYSAYLQPSEDETPTTIAQPTPTAIEQSLLDSIALTPTATEEEASEDGSAVTADDGASDGASQESARATATAAEGALAVETATEEPADQSTNETTEVEQPATQVEPAGPIEVPDDIVIPEGYHHFAVYAEAEVWVHVTLDYDSVGLDSVLAPGEIATFVAQTITVTSGNAALVRVYVDGEDWGTLGEPWDAVVTYPW